MFRTLSCRSRPLWKLLPSLQQFTINNIFLLPHFSTTTLVDDNSNKNDDSTALPPPIEVSYTESAGRGTFATRPIGAGDVIHTAKPLLTHPSLSLLHQVCYFCLKRLGPAVSDALNPTVRFCSDECRNHSEVFFEVEDRADWSAFDDHCRLRRLKYPFLVKRLACMVLSGAAAVDILDILQPANLFPEIILKMEEEFELLRGTLLKAGFDEKMDFLTKQWYIGVLARIRINAFRIELVGGSHEDLFSAAAASVLAESAVGNAIYMLPSFYNHDCDPNANMIWIDTANAKLKALRDVEAGEELRICYIDASLDYNARQAILSEGFGFRCRCQRCMTGD